jgi:hypothetical protein
VKATEARLADNRQDCITLTPPPWCPIKCSQRSFHLSRNIYWTTVFARMCFFPRFELCLFATSKLDFKLNLAIALALLVCKITNTPCLSLASSWSSLRRCIISVYTNSKTTADRIKSQISSNMLHLTSKRRESSSPSSRTVQNQWSDESQPGCMNGRKPSEKDGQPSQK